MFKKKNNILKYANNLIKSEYMKTNPQLLQDFDKILNGHCIYLPNFFCSKDDFTLLLELAKDLEQNINSGMISWSKHFKYENPDFSPTFNKIIKKMEDYFNVEIYHTRLNFYKDGKDWKPFHHDSHAYGNKSLREDFTMGASFGASRELSILHPKTDQTFTFPQNNGDVFAFTSEVNKVFQHGVPKSKHIDIGPRFSIIVWGRRIKITENNGSLDEIELSHNNYQNTTHFNTNQSNNNQSISKNDSLISNNIEITGKDIYNMVESMVNKFTSNKEKLEKKNNRRKNRVQGSWNKI